MKFPPSALLLCTLLAASPDTSAAFTVPASLDAALQRATPGQIITLPFSSTTAIRAINESPNRLAATGPTLLYSDDPETVPAQGILYQDTLPQGANRTYLYHVVGLPSDYRFSIVLENPGDTALTVTLTRRVVPAPSANYLQSGREGGRLYYESAPLNTEIVIPAGGRALLDPALDATIVRQNQLINAIHEFQSDGTVRVSSVMVAAGFDTVLSFPSLLQSPNDSSMRQGTFPAADRVTPAGGYTWFSGEGIVRLRVADSGVGGIDPPASGTDAERADAPTILRGNYAVPYDVTVTYQNTTGRHVALLVNPRGGNYAGYFRVTLNGNPAGGLIVPSTQLVVPPTTGAGVIALLETPTGTHRIDVEFIPAGASSLPIDILFVPLTPTARDPHGWLLTSE